VKIARAQGVQEGLKMAAEFIDENYGLIHAPVANSLRTLAAEIEDAR